MSKRRDDERLDELKEVIRTHQPQRSGWFARLIGTDNKSVERSLTQMHERGDLLQEDDKGFISLFDPAEFDD